MKIRILLFLLFLLPFSAFAGLDSLRLKVTAFGSVEVPIGGSASSLHLLPGWGGGMAIDASLGGKLGLIFNGMVFSFPFNEVALAKELHPGKTFGEVSEKYLDPFQIITCNIGLRYNIVNGKSFKTIAEGYCGVGWKDGGYIQFMNRVNGSNDWVTFSILKRGINNRDFTWGGTIKEEITFWKRISFSAGLSFFSYSSSDLYRTYYKPDYVASIGWINTGYSDRMIEQNNRFNFLGLTGSLTYLLR